jgi:CheY-like chemotaxis protein
VSPAKAPAPFVLIVDDHEETREGYEAFFQLQGYQTAGASSGEEALQHAQSGSPDVVVLDLHLRGAMSGLDVLDRLRAGAGRRSLAVILLTGADVREDELKRAPADRLLQKPILPDQLSAHIDELLSVRHRPTV